MTEAQTILKMIGEVSPDDTAKLDELNLRVAFFIEERFFPQPWRENSIFELDMRSIPNYCQSRDALKNIRPEGYACEITLWNKGIKAVCIKPDGDTVFNHPESLPFFKTEELAELHAIIQAIAYEREQNA